ncbi:MAG: hypothetical protein H0W81_06370 [Chloroflexi bacterium]|nr:hypothetical protein [Chloroflexota bacterium]
MPGGRACQAPPGRGSRFCFWHDPDKADDLAEARRLGGIRRKRERTVAAAYDFSGLSTVEAIRRILEIATLDALGLENSIVRARVLISAAMAAAKLLETGELEEGIATLETAIGVGRASPTDELLPDEAA